MVTESPTANSQIADLPLPLILEILQGSGSSQQFPVRIRSLSARGVILASDQVPGELDLDGSGERDSIIHLPTGEIRQIRGSLLWIRSQGEIDPGVVFGIELSHPDLKVRRALEEQLLAYPQDIKNLWDHWDAVQDEYERFVSDRPVNQRGQPAVPVPPRPPAAEAAASQTPPLSPVTDHTIYWVGGGAVLAGVAVYYLAPEFYRLFGAILAIYGSLAIVGKGVWSLVKRIPRSQVQT
jgi:hypothetical protein